MASTASYNAQKRAFQELLRLEGVDIICPVTGVKKLCLSGAIERRRAQELVAVLGKASTSIDMLAEDFDALIGAGKFEENETVLVVDKLEFVASSLERDPADPCVRFIATGDH